MLKHRCFNSIPIIDTLIRKLSTCFEYSSDQGKSWHKFRINHAIGTQYRDTDDYIGFHQDKTENITPGTPILILSMGEEREMHLSDLSGNLVDALVMKPGSLFILGPKTNATMKHAIVPGKDERVLDKGRTIGSRISLVLRDISCAVSATQMTKETFKSLKGAAIAEGIPLRVPKKQHLKLCHIAQLDNQYEQMLKLKHQNSASQSTTDSLETE